jgi:hypothetical protein
VNEVDEDVFLMANLFPADAGLAMVVWVSERGHARHDVPIKVNQSHGTPMLPGNLATVAVRPTPRLIAGQLSAADMQAVSEWIGLNEAALVAYWRISDQHRRVDAAIAAASVTDRSSLAPGA